ncbi:retrovirus-related pol polyprotein from transposon TNT 1-94 [Tanacetum coccineum]
MVTTICQEMMKMFKGKAIDQSNDTSTSKPHVAYIANHFNAKPKFIRPDNGTEIVNGECLAYLRKQGIVHQKSMVYTSQQNATVERKHKHLLDTARALKFHSGLPNKFWGDCMLTTTYLINKMHMKILDWKTLFEMLHGVHPSYDHLRVIDTRWCCSLIPAESDSLPHAHAQTTKTYYKHQDSRIKKAQELKTKTSANSDIKDNSFEETCNLMI